MEQSKKRFAAGKWLLGLLLLASALLLGGAVVWVFGGEWEWLSDRVPFQPAAVSVAALESPPEPEPVAPVHLGARLDVENILQKPELPNGCEATSVAIVLGYLGFDTDKMEIAREYLPRQPFELEQWGYVSGHPEQVYPGNPWRGGSGYYCYPGPVAETANLFLADQNTSYKARDVSGADEEILLALLDQGSPVIVWGSTDGLPLRESATMKWILEGTDRVYTPYVNLHVLVLTGYDEDSFYFSDPLGATEEMERTSFLEVFTEVGSRAVVIDKSSLVGAAA